MFRFILVLSTVFLISAHGYASDCSQVRIEPSNSAIWKDIKKSISKRTQSNSVALRQVLGKDGWYVVEYESNDYEPVIDIVKKTVKGYSIKAGWGGRPEEGDSITEYLTEKASGVPPILMQCFSPKGEPFVNSK